MKIGDCAPGEKAKYGISKRFKFKLARLIILVFMCCA